MRKPNKTTTYTCKCGKEFTLKKTIKNPRCSDCVRFDANERSRKNQYHKIEKYRERQHKWSIERKYGMSENDYNQLLEQQNEVCSICKEKDKRHRLSVDHDHQTGKVRGLLCHKCNRVLGVLNDDLSLLKSCISYLSKDKQELFVDYTPPSWDEYFLRMMYLVATKSKDPRTKIGAVLVKNKKIVSTGYNGICIGVDDTISERSERPEKYKWYEHGERNSLFAAATIGIPTLGSTMYTNGTPCADCTRAVVQSGVKRVVVHKTFEDAFYATVVAKNPNSQWAGHDDASHQMLREAGVDLVVWDGYLGVEAYMDGKKFMV